MRIVQDNESKRVSPQLSYQASATERDKNESVNYNEESSTSEQWVSITTTPSIKSSHISNSEDIVNENIEFSETVIDSFSDSNSESSDGEDDEDEFLSEKDKSLLVSLRQYAIEHGIDPEKFSVITEAEKKRWDGECFRGDLERDIRFYKGGINRKEDTRKYHKFLTDRERLVGEELLRQGILKSGLSTAWLDNLMEEWEKIHAQFTQISFEEKTLFEPR
ncbi:10299_t:CDS:2, partial [Ambispora leptoticha]